jgi:serine/threonine-protein kinase
MSIPVNTVLANRYRVLERLGGGGMGEVYRGMDHVLEREVAVKLLTEQSDEVNRRFLLEAQSMARLNHPNIVAVYDVGVDRDYSYIVLEYVRGRTLRDVEGGELNIGAAIDFSIQLLEALRYAHERDVVHRDLKPSNVIVTDDDILKVMDFGLARRLSDVANLEQSGEILGTIAYLPPERFLGKTGDRLSDLYSVGVLLYELLTGVLPFADPTADLALVLSQRVNTPPRSPHALNHAIPESLDELIMQLLAVDPEARPPDAATVIERLRSIRKHAARLDDAPAHAEPPPLASDARVEQAIERMRAGRSDGLAGRERQAVSHYRAAIKELAGPKGPAPHKFRISSR